MFKYFQGKVSRGFISIYTSRMILRCSGALLGLFLPIFLYKLFNFDIRFVIYYYLIGHVLYLFLVAMGAKYLNKIGLRRSLRISIVLGAVYYFLFYLLEQYSRDITWELTCNPLTILFIFILLDITAHRIMYWIPLHTDLAKFTDKGDLGKELSMMEVSTLILGAIGPLLSGLILSKYNYDVLFIIATFVFIIALMPLIFLPRTEESFSWSYFETWKEFFSHKRRKSVLAYIGDGAEGAVGIVIWPIFIWELLDGNFFEVGAISSLIVFVTIFLQLMVGKFVDGGDKRKMLKWGSCLYALGWIVKIFVLTAFHIFIVSTYHNLVRIFARTSFDAMLYEIAADQGHYVDEYTVIHEMAIQVGKIFMLTFALVLTCFFDMQWVFMIAAIASLGMNFLSGEKIR